MARDINFLRDRRKRLSKSQEQDKKLFRFSLIGFSVVIVMALVASGVRFFFIQQQSGLVREQEQFKSVILAQESVERQYLLLAGKVNAVQQIFKLRQDKQAAINYFYQQLGNDIILQEIEYDPLRAEEPLLYITVMAPDVFIFEQVQAVVASQEVKQKYPGISAGSIDRQVNGSYTLKLAVPLTTGT